MSRKGETDVVADVRLSFQHNKDVRLFRFHCGEFEMAHGGYLVVGVPGMSDLQGWKTTLITPEMVGTYVPVYTAIEVKRPGARTEKKRLEQQTSFINEVRAHGGLAGFATNPEQAHAIVQQMPGVPKLPR